MKKLLTVLIALSLVFGGFAAEPVADVNMVDFSGWASTTFGVDLESGDTGFLNETGVTFVMNFVPDDMSKSTTGSGIWGELVVLLDGSFKAEIDDLPEGSVPSFVSDDWVIDVAKIHIGDLYVGLESGDFAYGGDFYYPNALNYANEDEDDTGFIRDQNTTFAGYDQGLVVGYGNDMFSVEASVRTKPDTDNVSLDSIESISVITATASDKAITDANIKYFEFTTGDEAYGDEVAAKDLEIAKDYWKVVYNYDDINYWTNDYAAGAYVEVKPIQDLRIGLGGAYAFTGSDEKDFSAFAGVDYALMINDTMSVVPAVTYTMYNDYTKDRVNAKGEKEENLITENQIGMGLAYRWGPSVDDSSLLEDFFGTALVYDDVDEGDDDLLPGVSVFTSLGLLENAMDYYLPIMVNFYSGDIAAVPGLKAYGLFHANVASKATEGAFYNTATETEGASAASAAAALPGYLDNGLQVGLAASYALPIGDMTVTPSIGGLFSYASAKGTSSVAAEKEVTADLSSFMPAARVELAGAVANTTFTAEWTGAAFTNSKVVIDGTEGTASGSTNGLFTLKAKISL